MSNNDLKKQLDLANQYLNATELAELKEALKANDIAHIQTIFSTVSQRDKAAGKDTKAIQRQFEVAQAYLDPTERQQLKQALKNGDTTLVKEYITKGVQRSYASPAETKAKKAQVATEVTRDMLKADVSVITLGLIDQLTKAHISTDSYRIEYVYSGDYTRDEYLYAVLDKTTKLVLTVQVTDSKIKLAPLIHIIKKQAKVSLPKTKVPLIITLTLAKSVITALRTDDLTINNQASAIAFMLKNEAQVKPDAQVDKVARVQAAVAKAGFAPKQVSVEQVSELNLNLVIHDPAVSVASVRQLAKVNSVISENLIMHLHTVIGSDYISTYNQQHILPLPADVKATAISRFANKEHLLDKYQHLFDPFALKVGDALVDVKPLTALTPSYLATFADNGVVVGGTQINLPLYLAADTLTVNLDDLNHFAADYPSYNEHGVTIKPVVTLTDNYCQLLAAAYPETKAKDKTSMLNYVGKAKIWQTLRTPDPQNGAAVTAGADSTAPASSAKSATSALTAVALAYAKSCVNVNYGVNLPNGYHLINKFVYQLQQNTKVQTEVIDFSVTVQGTDDTLKLVQLQLGSYRYLLHPHFIINVTTGYSYLDKPGLFKQTAKASGENRTQYKLLAALAKNLMELRRRAITIKYTEADKVRIANANNLIKNLPNGNYYGFTFKFNANTGETFAYGAEGTNLVLSINPTELIIYSTAPNPMQELRLNESVVQLGKRLTPTAVGDMFGDALACVDTLHISSQLKGIVVGVVSSFKDAYNLRSKTVTMHPVTVTA